jgi:hypothetical protein
VPSFDAGATPRRSTSLLDPMPKTRARIWTFLAGMVGYVPTPPSWSETLRTLRGEYRLSVAELAQPLLVVAISLGMAAFLFRFSFEHNGIVPTTEERAALTIGSLVFVGLGLLLFSIYWSKYVFESGTLRVILPLGYLYKTYDLKTLRSVTRTRGKVVDSLTLRWEDEKHWILLPSSLLSALQGGVGI